LKSNKSLWSAQEGKSRGLRKRVGALGNKETEADQGGVTGTFQ